MVQIHKEGIWPQIVSLFSSNIDEVTFEGNKVFNVTIYILAQIYDVDILTGSKNAKFCFFLVGLCPH